MKALASRHHVTLLTYYGDTSEERHFPELEKMGVHLVPILREKIDASVGIREVLGGLVSGLPFTVIKYRDDRMAKAFNALHGSHDLIHCEHMHMAGYLERAPGKIKVLDAHNVEAQIAERLVPMETSLIKKALLSWNSRAMHRYEKNICSKIDLVLAVSGQDCDCYSKSYRANNVRILENGVDLDFFREAPADVTEIPKLVFVGMMGWMPNSDGVKFFATEILPMIRKEFPGIGVDLVGKDPPEDVVSLSKIAGVQVTGTVDDVRPYIWNSQVYIVPLRFGGGTRLKILEAFAMRKPVVSTSLGCEGIACRHEQELLIADTPAEFANAVIRLLRDPLLRQTLCDHAKQLVEKTYGWQALGGKLLGYIEEFTPDHSPD